jgi:hypothetical protein
MHMCVAPVGVGVLGAHAETLPVHTERLKVANSLECWSGFGVGLDRRATIGYACAFETIENASRSTIVWSVDITVLREYAAETPITATCIERTWIELIESNVWTWLLSIRLHRSTLRSFLLWW